MCCRKDEQCSWIGRKERWKVCPASVTWLLPRIILEDPELGSGSPSTVEAEQKMESFGLRHQKSLRTVTFSCGFFILGYPRKAVMLVIGVSKLPSMCRWCLILLNRHINRKQRWVAGHIQKCPRTLDFNEDFSLHTLFLPGPCAI